MTDKKRPSPEERALFRAAVGPVKRLRQERVETHSPRPPPRPAGGARSGSGQADLEDRLSDHYEPPAGAGGAPGHFARPGLQHSLLRKLRQGRVARAAELDLHGMTVPEARLALQRFLLHCRQRGLRCVCIIHGKGYRSPQGRPVLKARLNGWLRQWEDVLAFCPARPADGGGGALYVLLKTRH